MGTYYVRKSGNDGTGDGSTGAPWLTINKALATVPITGGHTILVGNGTYAEDTGPGLNYLMVQRQFVDYVTVQPELGAAGDVTLTNGAVTTYCLRLDASQYVRFKWLKITSTSHLNDAYCSLIYMTGAVMNHFEFIGCTLTVNSTALGTQWCWLHQGIVVHVVFDSCTIRQTGANEVVGIRCNRATAAIDDIQVLNCNIQLVGTCVYGFDHVTNFVVDGGYYESTGAGIPSISIGYDGSSAGAVTGFVKNAVIKSAASHALLIGSGTSNVEAAYNTICAGDNGIVIKENSGANVHNNKIIGCAATQNGIYCKAATNPVIQYNQIIVPAGNCTKVGQNSSTTNKSSGVTFRYNTCKVICSTGHLIWWGGAADDSGGGVCDYNKYRSGSAMAAWGAVRADADVNNLAELRAAWVGYGDGSNDSHSKKTRKPMYLG